MPVRGVDLRTAGGDVISVVGRRRLRVSSSEGFPQLVERTRDVRHTIGEPFEEVSDPFNHEERVTREASMCRLELAGSALWLAPSHEDARQHHRDENDGTTDDEPGHRPSIHGLNIATSAQPSAHVTSPSAAKRGGERIRTSVNGFAVRRLASRPPHRNSIRQHLTRRRPTSRTCPTHPSDQRSCRLATAGCPRTGYARPDPKRAYP